MYRNYSKEKIMLLKEQYKKGDTVELLDDIDKFKKVEREHLVDNREDIDEELETNE